MKKNLRTVGAAYEKLAVEYLTGEGLNIICANYRTAFGEIDLIARDKDTLVFVEVKYRSNIKKGYPEEAVTAKKQDTIRKQAAVYLLKNGYSDQTLCRFDVMAFLGERIRWIKNAF